MHLKKPVYKLILAVVGLLIIFISILLLPKSLKELAVYGMNLHITYPLVMLFSVMYYDPETEKVLDMD